MKKIFIVLGLTTLIIFMAGCTGGEKKADKQQVASEPKAAVVKTEAVKAPAVKITYAKLSDIDKITVGIKDALKNTPAFKVVNEEKKNVEIVEAKSIDDKKFLITVKEGLDPSKNYFVSAEGGDVVKTVPEDILINEKFVYTGKDLGCTYTPEKSVFKVWTPVADNVTLFVYDNSMDKEADVYSSKGIEKGVWTFEVNKDLKNKQYVYSVVLDDVVNEVVDPYARAENTNGLRGIVVDLSETNPSDWANDKRPVVNKYSNTNNYVDHVLWEIHVRDYSISENSGMKNKGKYLAFTENDTTLPGNDTVKTGIAHLKELGITTVHINPMYDFGSVDESGADKNKYYNWGYDPYQYNTPEGSYSTNPDDTSRIKELKAMVKNLHDNGIRVVMDVVYNHTYTKGDSLYDKLVPKYYYRMAKDGDYSGASGCGNEVATEKPMARKFVVDSVKYWVEEYHIDGFRFDLMGIMDRDTMIQIEQELHAIDPSIIMYGEPWYCGETPLDPKQQMNKGGQQGLKIAIFNDNIREGIKGPGFAQGKKGKDGEMKRVVAGSIKYGDPSVDGKEAEPYYMSPDKIVTAGPDETINYVSCHDNHTLYDKLRLLEKSEDVRINMNKLSQAMIFTSQGIPLILAGEEMLRSKNKNENSYNAGDKDNQIDWSRKAQYKDVFDYYKGLIELRNKHKAFRMTTAEDIRKNLKFYTDDQLKIGDAKITTLIAYKLDAKAAGDEWNEIVVIYNGAKTDAEIKMPDGNNGAEWTVVVEQKEAGVTPIKTAVSASIKDGKFKGETIVVPSTTAIVMYR